MDRPLVLPEHGAVSGEGRQRRLYPVEEKRRMVEQTLEAGASVAKVAQANGVNPNLLFLWRRQHREGRLTTQVDSSMRLLPVTVMDAPMSSESSAGEAASPGSLHIELPKGRIWIEGRIDAASLRTGWRFCCGDRSSRGHAHLDRCRSYRHAPRLRRAERAGADGAR